MIDSLTVILTALVLSAKVHPSEGAGCEIVDSKVTGNGAGNEIGLIFVPGDTIPGERYIPLVKAILADFPGNAWGAVTRDWANDFPNPVGMTGAVQACYEQVNSSSSQAYRRKSLFQNDFIRLKKLASPPKICSLVATVWVETWFAPMSQITLKM